MLSEVYDVKLKASSSFRSNKYCPLVFMADSPLPDKSQRVVSSSLHRERILLLVRPVLISNGVNAFSKGLAGSYLKTPPDDVATHGVPLASLSISLIRDNAECSTSPFSL